MHKASFSFTEEYNKLNKAQKQAVETTEGPVLVVAGPGTGKTQILAARVGNILDKGLAHAENILCLTFTDAGVTAMRKRLIKFIGTEAYKVNIHTFHSFCNKVIQDYPDVFGFGDMEPLSELEEVELFEQLIDNFEDTNPLKRWRGDVYYDSKRLKALFSFMKNENFSAIDIEKAVVKYLEELPTKEGFFYKRKYKEFNAGDPNINKINAEKEKLELTIAAANQFNNYQELKRKANRYDFTDMITNVLLAFKENEWLLSTYQEQFQYFLVDEYQDTNGSQNAILEALYSYWDNPNVFVVGDDDQSIFRFQGANLENIMHFYNATIAKLPAKEQEKRIIVLKQNYRSTQNILEIAKDSINENNGRLINKIKTIALDKNIEAAGEVEKKPHGLPKIVSYPNASHETADIANKIKTLKESGIPLKNIGVLYLQHQQSEDLQQCLNQLNIPFNTKRKVNILNEPFTNMLLNILRYLDGEHKIAHSREDLLFDMLNYPFFSLKPIEVSRLSFELRESRFSKPKTTWREALFLNNDVFTETAINEFNGLATLIDKWLSNMLTLPLQLLFQEIIDDLKVVEYIENSPNKVWLLQELKTLFDFIKAENHKHLNCTIDQFLNTIDLHINYNISIPYVKSTYAEDAVQFNTIHGAKGLEYEQVFVLGCIDSKWEKKKGGNSGFKLPEGIFETIDKEEATEDLRRLFFVAITRAEKDLQISYYTHDENSKELMPTQLITEIADNENITFEEIQLSENEIMQYTIYQLRPEIIKPELLEENMLKSVLENYKMSVTHLNNYLNCPLKFYYHNFIRIPQAKNQYIAFGSAVHNAIEKLFLTMKENDKTFPSLEDFVELGIKELYKEQDSFTQKQYEKYKDYIKVFFKDYYNNYIDSWQKNVSLEKNMEGVYKGIELRGKIDKIEYLDYSKVNIIDYKTGKFDSKKKAKFKRPSTEPKNPENPTYEEMYGGDYWRQAVFYKILLETNKDLNKQIWNLAHVVFDFVEPNAKDGSFHIEPVEISTEDINIVKHQIEDAWQNIQALNFEGCKKEDCSFCNGEMEKLTEDEV
ncbi:MAG: ATP-dependent DNA helicase [Chitinophagales bacterium]